MSLNNISLPSQMIADLYGHSLVDGTATAMPQKEAVPFLGRGGKNIVIAVNEEKAPFLPDNELGFLTKVLTACQLGLMDVAIVNWHNMPHHDVKAVMEQFNATSVILFGVEPDLFGLAANVPAYTVHAVGNTRFVTAPPLRQIEESKEAKTLLWMALKQVFGI